MKIRAVKMDSSLDKAEVSMESPVKERIAGGLPRTFITFENLSRPYPQGIYSAGNRESKVVRALSSVQSVVSFEAWYKAPALLSNGHASTIAPALLRNAPQVTYERQLLKTPDGGTLGLDFFFPVQEQAARVHSETGVVVIVPGLGGDSSDSYVRSMAANVAKAGFRGVVVNSRGCGGVPVTSPRLFSARRGSTCDLQLALDSLFSSLPSGTPLFAIGWSNGGSILLNTVRDYMGAGRAPPLAGAVAISVPFDMRLPSRAMVRPFQRLVYDRNFVRSLLPKIEDFLGRWGRALPHIDPEAVRRSATLKDIEERFVSPMFGYESVQHYYSDASSADVIPLLPIPTLCISSGDDPIAPAEGIPFERIVENENVALVYTDHGGHIGWPGSLTDLCSPWCEGVAVEFLQRLVES